MAATTIVPTLEGPAIAEFAGTLRGAVIQSADPTYDEARSVLAAVLQEFLDALSHRRVSPNQVGHNGPLFA